MHYHTDIRDFAAIEQLIVLSNLESINAEMIKMQMPSSDRIIRLNEIAIYQMVSLSNSEPIKKIKIVLFACIAQGDQLRKLNDLASFPECRHGRLGLKPCSADSEGVIHQSIGFNNCPSVFGFNPQFLPHAKDEFLLCPVKPGPHQFF